MSLLETAFHPFEDELCRVKLRQGHTPGSDYINASFIDVCSIPLPIVLSNYRRLLHTQTLKKEREEASIALCSYSSVLLVYIIILNPEVKPTVVILGLQAEKSLHS